jgi:hypothetical protein
VCPFSETSYYAALSLKRLGQPEAARSLLQALLAYARDLAGSEAKIDYFATSLPTMLLFDDDIQLRRLETAEFLEAQAQAGLGRRQEARDKLASVLARNPNHALADDFLKQLDQVQLD